MSNKINTAREAIIDWEGESYADNSISISGFDIIDNDYIVNIYENGVEKLTLVLNNGITIDSNNKVLFITIIKDSLTEGLYDFILKSVNMNVDTKLTIKGKLKLNGINN